MRLPRELGLPLGRFEPGPLNSITDVAGVRVGHSTVIEEANDEHGALRTGVTAIWPVDGLPWEEAVYAGATVLNGHGELIGICQVEEFGLLRSPVMLTSSLSIGAVYDGTARWIAQQDDRYLHPNFMMPIVSEVSDLILSDNRAFPIGPQHAAEALDSVDTARPAEGSVGAGTGTVCYDVKGGIGTASRVVPCGDFQWTVGALLLTNFGERANLAVCGVTVGEDIDVPMPATTNDGSCIVVIATDAPMLPHQLKRLGMRGLVGLCRSGSFVSHTSGEIALAFSTANRFPFELGQPETEVSAVADGFNPGFNPLFEAVVELTDEAALNSMFAAETMVGFEGNVVPGLPVDRVLELLQARNVI